MSGPGNSTPDDTGKGRSSPFLRWVTGSVDILDWSGRIVAVSTLCFLFVVLLLNVVLRYAFHSGIAWAYEIHAVLLPWLVAGGIVIAAARGRNIAITLLPDMLPPAGRRALVLAIQISIIVISVSVLWSSQPILKASQFQKLSTLGIRQVWGYSSLIYAFGAMTVIAVMEAIRAILDGGAIDHDPSHSSLS